MSTIELRSSRASVARRPCPGSARAVREDRSWAGAVRRAARAVLVWHERARQRRHLELLSDHMLRDIGLTRADVHLEASKPFWQR